MYETSGSDQFFLKKKNPLIYAWNDQYSLRVGMVRGSGGGGVGRLILKTRMNLNTIILFSGKSL